MLALPRPFSFTSPYSSASENGLPTGLLYLLTIVPSSLYSVNILNAFWFSALSPAVAFTINLPRSSLGTTLAIGNPISVTALVATVAVFSTKLTPV